MNPRTQLSPLCTTDLSAVPDEFFKEINRLHGKEIKPTKLAGYVDYFADYNMEVVVAIMRLSPSWKKFLNYFSRSYKVEVTIS